MSTATLEKPPVQKSTRTICVEQVLYRQGTASFNPGDGTVNLSISSDTPYLRFDWRAMEQYYEVLDHRPGGVDLTRLKAGSALLFNHNRNIHLGLINEPELKDGKCRVKAKISQADDIAGHRTRLQEGILKDSSVGYEVEDEGEEIDEIDGIPVIRFKWFPFEASLVTVAADIGVGIGRERALGKPEGKTREILIREKSRNPEKKDVDTEANPDENASQSRIETTHMSAATEDPPKAKTQAEREAEQREKTQQIKDGIAAARKRETEINAIAKRATVPLEKKGEFETAHAKAVEDAADDEKAVDRFRTFVFENFWGNPQPVETPNGSADLNGSNGNRGGRILTVGEQFVSSEQFKKLGSKTGTRRSIALELPGYTMLGARARAQRAMVASTDLPGISVAPQKEIIALGVQRMTIMDLIAPGTTNAALIPYPIEKTFDPTSGAEGVAEAGTKPNWDPDLDVGSAAVKKVAVTTKVPDEMLADFPSFASYIDQRLPYLVDFETERQILYGTGTNELIGITETPDIQTRAIGADSPTDALYNMLTLIRVNAFFEPDGYAINPLDWEEIKLLKDLNGQYIAGGPFYAPYGNGVFVEVNMLWGKPVVITTAVTEGNPIAGAWRLGAQYFLREGMRIESTNSNEDDFLNNLIALRAEHRLALAVYRPACFVEGTGF